MNDDLRALRTDNGLSAREIVTVVRTLYPKFDRPLLTKCERGDLYGVDLRDDAMAALTRYAGATPPPERRKRGSEERRTKGVRCYCRMEKSAHVALQKAIKADGYATTQEWFDEMVRRYLAGRREEAADP